MWCRSTSTPFDVQLTPLQIPSCSSKRRTSVSWKSSTLSSWSSRNLTDELLALNVYEPALDVVGPVEVVPLVERELPCLTRRRPVLDRRDEDRRRFVDLDHDVRVRPLTGR